MECEQVGGLDVCIHPGKRTNLDLITLYFR